MRGLVLEGGGAKGAYHIGVVKALYENGYTFDGFTGTSIGAINAAVLAQDDFDLALEFWSNISMDQLFEEDELYLLNLLHLSEIKLDTKLPSNIKKAFVKIISGRGISTSKMKRLLKDMIDEDKIRASGKDYGLVTISFNGRKALELMLDEIPQGMLHDYIMASASFPGFRPAEIGENRYYDGGLYNNLPVSLLSAKDGYSEIIAVRTVAPGFLRKFDPSRHIKLIIPSGRLGNLMLFTPENSRRNIELGYADGLKFLAQQD